MLFTAFYKEIQLILCRIELSLLARPSTIFSVFYVAPMEERNSSTLGVGRKEGNVLFNDALNTFYLRLYGIRHMVKDHSDSERGNPLPPHISVFKRFHIPRYFMCHIPQYLRGKERKCFIYRCTQHILFTVIWRHTYGKGPLRLRGRKPAAATWATLFD